MSRAVDAAIALTKMADWVVPGIRHDFGMIALDYLDAHPDVVDAIIAYNGESEPPSPLQEAANLGIAIENLRACPCREHRQPLAVLEAIRDHAQSEPSDYSRGTQP